MQADSILDDGTLGLGTSGTSLEAPAAEAIQLAAKWGRYYLYVVLGSFVVQVVFQVVLMTQLTESTGQTLGSSLGSMIFSILFGLAFYVYPLLKFWSFTKDAPAAIQQNSNELFGQSMSSLKSTYKYIGLAIFIVLGLYAILLIIMVVAGLASVL